jgi:hypothetical protein
MQAEEEAVKTYMIVRFVAGKGARTVKRGLSLEEAQAHCKDPETSSTTCTNAIGKQRTKKHGAWFDGYTEEE